MSAVVSHLARDEKMTPSLTGCHLMIPAICNDAFIPQKYATDWKSWEQLPEAPVLNHKASEMFLNSCQYLCAPASLA